MFHIFWQAVTEFFTNTYTSFGSSFGSSFSNAYTHYGSSFSNAYTYYGGSFSKKFTHFSNLYSSGFFAIFQYFGWIPKHYNYFSAMFEISHDYYGSLIRRHNIGILVKSTNYAGIGFFQMHPYLTPVAHYFLEINQPYGYFHQYFLRSLANRNSVVESLILAQLATTFSGSGFSSSASFISSSLSDSSSVISSSLSSSTNSSVFSDCLSTISSSSSVLSDCLSSTISSSSGSISSFFSNLILNSSSHSTTSSISDSISSSINANYFLVPEFYSPFANMDPKEFAKILLVCTEKDDILDNISDYLIFGEIFRCSSSSFSSSSSSTFSYFYTDLGTYCSATDLYYPDSNYPKFEALCVFKDEMANMFPEASNYNRNNTYFNDATAFYASLSDSNYSNLIEVTDNLSEEMTNQIIGYHQYTRLFSNYLNWGVLELFRGEYPGAYPGYPGPAWFTEDYENINTWQNDDRYTGLGSDFELFELPEFLIDPEFIDNPEFYNHEYPQDILDPLIPPLLYNLTPAELLDLRSRITPTIIEYMRACPDTLRGTYITDYHNYEYYFGPDGIYNDANYIDDNVEGDNVEGDNNDNTEDAPAAPLYYSPKFDPTSPEYDPSFYDSKYDPESPDFNPGYDPDYYPEYSNREDDKYIKHFLYNMDSDFEDELRDIIFDLDPNLYDLLFPDDENNNVDNIMHDNPLGFEDEQDFQDFLYDMDPEGDQEFKDFLYDMDPEFYEEVYPNIDDAPTYDPSLDNVMYDDPLDPTGYGVNPREWVKSEYLEDFFKNKLQAMEELQPIPVQKYNLFPNIDPELYAPYDPLAPENLFPGMNINPEFYSPTDRFAPSNITPNAPPHTDGHISSEDEGDIRIEDFVNPDGRYYVGPQIGPELSPYFQKDIPYPEPELSPGLVIDPRMTVYEFCVANGLDIKDFDPNIFIPGYENIVGNVQPEFFINMLIGDLLEGNLVLDDADTDFDSYFETSSEQESEQELEYDSDPNINYELEDEDFDSDSDYDLFFDPETAYDFNPEDYINKYVGDTSVRLSDYLKSIGLDLDTIHPLSLISYDILYEFNINEESFKNFTIEDIQLILGFEFKQALDRDWQSFYKLIETMELTPEDYGLEEEYPCIGIKELEERVLSKYDYTDDDVLEFIRTKPELWDIFCRTLGWISHAPGCTDDTNKFIDVIVDDLPSCLFGAAVLEEITNNSYISDDEFYNSIEYLEELVKDVRAPKPYNPFDQTAAIVTRFMTRPNVIVDNNIPMETFLDVFKTKVPKPSIIESLTANTIQNTHLIDLDVSRALASSEEHTSEFINQYDIYSYNPDNELVTDSTDSMQEIVMTPDILNILSHDIYRSQLSQPESVKLLIE